MAGAISAVIKDTVTGEYLVIPVLPEEHIKSGMDSINETVQVLDIGDVDFRKGSTPGVVSWDSFFPVRYDPSYCSVSDLKDVLEYSGLFYGWKANGTKLRVVVTGLGIDGYYKVDDYTDVLKGCDGDVYYSLGFKEYRDVEPVQVATGSGVPRSGATPAARVKLPAKEVPSTYTVSSGDYLVRIGKKLGIPWRSIYDKNRDLIGPDPNVISVGQVFTV